jgi:hypothetical protein
VHQEHEISTRRHGGRPIDSEFDMLNNLFYFSLKTYCDPEGQTHMGCYFFIREKDSFLSHVVSGQSMYFNPPWLLVVQRVEILRTCHA